MHRARPPSVRRRCASPIASLWGSSLGPLVGLTVGGGVGWALQHASTRGWTDDTFSAIGGLCTAALCWLGAEAIGGNGFMAAFVGGMVFGSVTDTVCEAVHTFVERDAELLMVGVFLLLGSALAPAALAAFGPTALLYAALSLTVIRMLPVAVSLVGTGVGAPTVGFLGWFGPRGLASILFGLLLLEASHLAHADQVFHVVLLTVLLSVFSHGLTASWASERYGAAIDDSRHEPVTAHPLRRRG